MKPKIFFNNLYFILIIAVKMFEEEKNV